MRLAFAQSFIRLGSARLDMAIARFVIGACLMKEHGSEIIQTVILVPVQAKQARRLASSVIPLDVFKQTRSTVG